MFRDKMGVMMKKLICIGLMIASIVVSAESIHSTKLLDVNGEIVGSVSVSLYDDRSLFEISLWNIEPGWHAMHIHENGDCSDAQDGFKKAGAHVNPDNKAHGLRNDEGFHRGDLANVYAFAMPSSQKMAQDPIVQARAEQIIPWVSKSKPLGKVAIILHEGKDDYQADQTGGAGKRIACGVIELGKTS